MPLVYIDHFIELVQADHALRGASDGRGGTTAPSHTYLDPCFIRVFDDLNKLAQARRAIEL